MTDDPRLVPALVRERRFPADLVGEFAAVFARFEWALKATRRYVDSDRFGNAKPGWGRFLEDAAGEPDVLSGPGRYLVKRPPKRQVLEGGSLRWKSREGTGAGNRAVLESAKIVRNNLFHGGKFHEEPAPDVHDEDLIASAKAVVWAALELECAREVRKHFFDDLPEGINAQAMQNR